VQQDDINAQPGRPRPSDIQRWEHLIRRSIDETPKNESNKRLEAPESAARFARRRSLVTTQTKRPKQSLLPMNHMVTRSLDSRPESLEWHVEAKIDQLPEASPADDGLSTVSARTGQVHRQSGKAEGSQDQQPHSRVAALGLDNAQQQMPLTEPVPAKRQMPENFTSAPQANATLEPMAVHLANPEPTSRVISLGAAALQQDRLDRAIALEKYFPEDRPLHFLGHDTQANFLAHSFACASSRPIRLLQDRGKKFLEWKEVGRCILLDRAGEVLPQHNISLEWAGTTGPQYPIRCLIVAAPAGAIVQAISKVAHRIDKRTTVYLISNGMGIVDSINRAFFPDPSGRPLYVVGHLGHTIHQSSKSSFSIIENRPGKIWFVDPFHEARRDGKLDSEAERSLATKSLAFGQLLKKTFPQHVAQTKASSILLQKAPLLAFGAVADPLAATLDCTYGDLRFNPFNRQMLHDAISELATIMATLPELQTSESIGPRTRLAWGGGLIKKVDDILYRRKEWKPPKKLLEGKGSDLDFTLGWFLNQARRLGVKCTILRTLMSQVKAGHELEVEKLRRLAHGGDGSIPYLQDEAMKARLLGLTDSNQGSQADRDGDAWLDNSSASIW
jgi:ketopantoate reductase